MKIECRREGAGLGVFASRFSAAVKRTQFYGIPCEIHPAVCALKVCRHRQCLEPQLCSFDTAGGLCTRCHNSCTE